MGLVIFRVFVGGRRVSVRGEDVVMGVEVRVTILKGF